MTNQLIIAGGVNDPNIRRLTHIAVEMDIPVHSLIIEPGKSPAFHWDLKKNTFRLDGQDIRPSAAFVRRDVFHQPGQAGHDRALAWYTACMGWIATQPGVRILNRNSMMTYTNKLLVLDWAAQAGFLVPDTYVINDLTETVGGYKDFIAKPVMGGGYCHLLSSITDDTELRSGYTAHPAIVQQYIKGDDIRVYRVDEEYFAFSITSNKIDYRQTSNHTIEVLEKIPKAIVKHLSDLMNRMQLNWGAADFKRCARTEQWYFLEVNSNPMFSVFDRKTKGKIGQSILKFILNRSE